jgi:hypothetical protein
VINNIVVCSQLSTVCAVTGTLASAGQQYMPDGCWLLPCCEAYFCAWHQAAWPVILFLARFTVTQLIRVSNKVVLDCVLV